jgi:hypothetical protein
VRHSEAAAAVPSDLPARAPVGRPHGRVGGSSASREHVSRRRSAVAAVVLWSALSAQALTAAAPQTVDPPSGTLREEQNAVEPGRVARGTGGAIQGPETPMPLAAAVPMPGSYDVAGGERLIDVVEWIPAGGGEKAVLPLDRPVRHFDVGRSPDGRYVVLAGGLLEPLDVYVVAADLGRIRRFATDDGRRITESAFRLGEARGSWPLVDGEGLLLFAASVGDEVEVRAFDATGAPIGKARWPSATRELDVAVGEPREHRVTVRDPAGAGSPFTFVHPAAPRLRLVRSSLDFRRVPAGVERRMWLELHNAGRRPLDLRLVLEGDPAFALEGPSTLRLGPGDTARRAVRFRSWAGGDYRATCRLDAAGGAAVALRGSVRAAAGTVESAPPVARVGSGPGAPPRGDGEPSEAVPDRSSAPALAVRDVVVELLEPDPARGTALLRGRLLFVEPRPAIHRLPRVRVVTGRGGVGSADGLPLDLGPLGDFEHELVVEPGEAIEFHAEVVADDTGDSRTLVRSVRVRPYLRELPGGAVEVVAWADRPTRLVLRSSARRGAATLASFVVRPGPGGRIDVPAGVLADFAAASPDAWLSVVVTRSDGAVLESAPARPWSGR